MNIAPAEVQGRAARLAGHALGLDRAYDRLPAGARIEIGIRPEFVGIAAPAAGLLTARVERIDDLGRKRFAWVRVGDLKIAASVPAGASIAGGGEAGLVFDPAQIHVYADSRRVEGTA
jgi:glycerol transport system ATP-binding protein